VAILGCYGALCKGLGAKYSMTTRGICPACNSRDVAINYIKEDVVHYRTRCDACLRKGKKVPKKTPAWYRAGYRKKSNCEHCGFVATMPDKQLNVYHVDGNLKNIDRVNLRTVCLNCQPLLYQERLPWKPAESVLGF
jgi:Zn ribbon nucleic-acid-binding protein